MKALILLNLLTILLFSCCKPVDISQTEQKEGITYLKGESIPFKGKVIQKYDPKHKFCLTTYKKGLPNGKQTTWFENGKKQSEVIYVDFYMNGPARFWHRNGQLSEKGNYSHCMEDGLWTYYYENGKVKESGYYNKGEKTGIWKEWSEDGKSVKEVNYSEKK